MSTLEVVRDPEARRRLPRRGLGFALAASGAAALTVAASAPSPFYPTLEQQLHMTPLDVTLAFAVYAVALLGMLLIVGSLSDHIGRRPVISTGFALLSGSMVLILVAPNAVSFLLARGLQGAASGILLSAVAATVTDFAHPRRSERAALVNSVAPMTGLAIGALVAGLGLGVIPDAADAVFGVLAALYASAALAIWLVPETSARAAGALGSLKPRIAVPADARRLFLISAPLLVAGWATGGLFFSLSADIAIAQLELTTPLAQGLVLALLPGTGVIAVLAMRRRGARLITIFGSSTLAVGMLLTLAALVAGSLAGYVVAVAVTGAGFGTSFMGVVASLSATVPGDRRAELFSALYTVSYLAFGIPTLIAGVFTSFLPLPVVTAAYGALVVVFAGVAAAIRLRSRL